jgi:hypothetical protein
MLRTSLKQTHFGTAMGKLRAIQKRRNLRHLRTNRYMMHETVLTKLRLDVASKKEMLGSQMELLQRSMSLYKKLRKLSQYERRFLLIIKARGEPGEEEKSLARYEQYTAMENSKKDSFQRGVTDLEERYSEYQKSRTRYQAARDYCKNVPKET